MPFEFKRRNRLRDRVPWLSGPGRDPRGGDEIRISWVLQKGLQPPREGVPGDLSSTSLGGSGSGVEMATREVTLQEVSASGVNFILGGLRLKQFGVFFRKQDSEV